MDLAFPIDKKNELGAMGNAYSALKPYPDLSLEMQQQFFEFF